jgi:transposase-like protein
MTGYGDYGRAKHFYLPVTRCPSCRRLQLKAEAAIGQVSEERYKCRHCGMEFTTAESERQEDIDADGGE